MRLADYKSYFDHKGINLPDSLLNRYKKFIYHQDITLDYISARKGDDVWWEASVLDGRNAGKKRDEGQSDGQIIQEAKEALAAIVSEKDERIQAVELAQWMAGWLGSAGTTKVRNALNARLAAAESTNSDKVVRLPIMSTTRDELSRIMGESGIDSNYDQALQKILSFYARMHGMDAESG